MNELALEFLRTGRVRGIGLGARRDDLLRTFEAPPDTARVSADTEILRYGSCQLTVTGDTVVAIAVTSEVDGDTSPHDLGALLSEAGIDWAVERELTFDKQLSLRAANGVLIMFDLERGTLQKLMTT